MEPKKYRLPFVVLEDEQEHTGPLSQIEYNNKYFRYRGAFTCKFKPDDTALPMCETSYNFDIRVRMNFISSCCYFFDERKGFENWQLVLEAIGFSSKLTIRFNLKDKDLMMGIHKELCGLIFV